MLASRTSSLLAAALAVASLTACGEVTEDPGNDRADSGVAADAAPDATSDAALPGVCERDADCDDGIFCNGQETCAIPEGETRGSCVSGTPPCDDGIACTIDSCDEAQQACNHEPDHEACDDGLFCTGEEVCVVGVGCEAGDPPDPDDGVSCTVRTCTEDDGVRHEPDDSLCDDGIYCNGLEACDANEGCVVVAQPVVEWSTNDGSAGTIELHCGQTQTVDSVFLLGCGEASARCEFLSESDGRLRARMDTACGNETGPPVSSGCSTVSEPDFSESVYSVACCFP
jgi:hypothetical protein